MNDEQEQEDPGWRELRLALADNPYASAPWRTWDKQLKESGIVERR